MTSSSRNADRGSVLGITQWLMLGTLAVAGTIIAALIQSTSLGNFTLAETISNAPIAQRQGFGAFLWIAEVLAYALIALLISRHVLIAVSAIILGLLVRFFMCGLIALLLINPLGCSFSTVLLQMDSHLWAFRALAILIALASLAIPFHRLIKTGYGIFSLEETGGKPSTPPRSFAFDASKPGSRLPSRIIVRTAEPVTGVAPPEGFLPVVPAKGVTGMVTLPARVILSSIIEAENVLPRDRQIRVRLAYLVPQLSRGTVWLTWNQIFPGGSDDPNPLAKEEMAAAFRDRWVRISAKEYVKQVPPEFFTSKQKPPAWLALPRVPQEDQFEVTSMAGDNHGVS